MLTTFSLIFTILFVQIIVHLYFRNETHIKHILIQSNKRVDAKKKCLIVNFARDLDRKLF